MTDVPKPWNYDRLLSTVRANWDAHNKTCTSLPHFWLGYRGGGVTCLSDVTDCDTCHATFYLDGLTFIPVPGDDDGRYLCECCQRSRRKKPRKRFTISGMFHST